MRVGLLLALAVTLTLAVASAAGGSTSSSTPSLRVTFSGSAAGDFSDVERWVLLSSNECYLRRMRNQSTSLTWNVGFTGGRSLSALAAATVKGAVKGTQVQRLL